MSSIGKPDRQLWYDHNVPEEELEKFRAETYMKFLYGDILEDLLLFLAELAGHKVEGRQDEQEIEGIKGHRDAVIDGVLTDEKSASSYSFNKFTNGKLRDDDPFGYYVQIQSYLEAGQEDPVITDKDRAAFFVIDKTLGKIALDFHKKDPELDIRELYKHKKEVINQKEPPERCYEAVPYGQSGNMALSTPCSYCAHAKRCWPGSRTFLYSHKPVTLVKVVKEPQVPELK